MVLALSLVACAAPTASPTPTTGTLSVSGPVEAMDLLQDIAESFLRARPGLSLRIERTSNATAVDDVANGRVDVAVVTGPVAGLPPGLRYAEIARQPIIMIVHPDNPVKNLTLDDLGNTYAQRITDWDQVGGLRMPIMVLAREPGSSLRLAVDAALLGSGSRLTPNALLLPSDEAMVATVSRRPEAIGYASSLPDVGTVKALTVNGEHPSGIARGRAYPLWQSIHIVAPTQTSPIVADFFRYVKNRQVQRLIAAWGYGQGEGTP